ncbi:UBX domain-containing protein 6 [Condylostylus longicornis]|uniref:UBX domain-containing protein 6 n=1 Tax=Condylostylus longicornis TaxID=2530218 RepID=UPI00244DE9FE|nr:UBX domain-containing protein 6 [Condylostylus longicornis]
MSKIKKFFSKKKEEAKFRLNAGGGSLGQGRKLNAVQEPSTSQKKVKDAYVPPKRKELSSEAKAAAAAALARVEKKDKKEFNTSLAAIRAQVKRELEEEKIRSGGQQKASDECKRGEERENWVCKGVFFRCTLVSGDILPRKEWKAKIKEFLYQQLENETALTACLIIQNCNAKEKAEQCVETLRKYIENLINHPDEEKYHKIRMNNKIFCEKVRYIEGALEFLRAAGFQEIEIDNEPFLIWASDNMEKEIDLNTLLEGLDNAEPLTLELDRNIQVLLPSQARRSELPADFYRISAEEIKREQQLRTEALENAQILKTKAMREREEQRFYAKYRFAVSRIKFPDGLYLQGTFNVYEKLNDVYEFVQSCINDDIFDFSLIGPTGIKFSEDDMDKSLFDLRLIPNTILIFQDESESKSSQHFLKDELLLLIQEM